MDDLNFIVDHAARFTQAAELANALTDCLSSISSRHTPGCVRFPDAQRASALDALYRAKHALNFNLRRLDEQRNASLSPTARLDDDVLKAVLLSVSRDIQSPEKRMKQAIAFSHISRRWRRTAVDCASLWVDISVTAHDRIESQESPWHPVAAQYRPSQSAMITTFAHRANTAPLTVTIVDNGTRKGNAITGFPYITSNLRSLTMAISSLGDMIAYLRHVRDSTSSLAQVSLSLTMVGSLFEPRSRLDTQPQLDLSRLAEVLEQKAPSLREFYFHKTISLPLDLPRMSMCEKLVLKVNTLESTDILIILSNYPSLRILDCEIDAFALATETNRAANLALGSVRPRTRLENLEALIFRVTTEATCFMMDNLVAPKLKMLSLSDEGPPRRTFGDPTIETPLARSVCSMIQMSHVSLGKLEFGCLGASDCVPIMRHSPAAVSLTFGKLGSTTRQFLDAIKLDHIVSILHPASMLNLLPETLVYRGSYEDALRPLLGMVRARKALHVHDPLTNRPLRRIVLASDAYTRGRLPSQERSLLDEIGSMLEEGLVVDGWEFRNGGIDKVGSDSPTIMDIRSLSVHGLF